MSWWIELHKHRITNSSESVLGSAGHLSEAAVDLLPFILERRSGLLTPAEQGAVVAAFKRGIEVQLELLRQALDATSAVLLWQEDEKAQLVTYCWSSRRQHLSGGPFLPGEGVFGGLNGREDFALFPYRASGPRIPYYHESVPVAGVYARAINASADQHGTQRIGMLCIDRAVDAEWAARERELIARTAEQVGAFYLLCRDHLYAAYERRTLQQLIDGLRTLNSALDSRSVYAAAGKAIEAVVECDVIVAGTVVGRTLRVDFTTHALPESGPQTYPLADSVVAQVIKYRRILPDSATPSKTSPVIRGLSFFQQFSSLLVVPLRRDEKSVSGVFIVASRQANKFHYGSREQLQMIADLLAVKLDLAAAHDQINRMTLTDSLTGIANRRAFERALSAMHERAKRRESRFSLILCDIDFFKRVNDSYGHPFGDQVIQKVAEQLQRVVRVGDLAARIGGEEFAVLLEDSGGDGAYDVAERLRCNIETMPLQYQQQRVQVTVSLGIAAFPEHAQRCEQILTFADQALYRAKESGRNRVVKWNG